MDFVLTYVRDADGEGNIVADVSRFAEEERDFAFCAAKTVGDAGRLRTTG